MTFLVPDSAHKPDVYRYKVESREDIMPPLILMTGWWVCVTDGEIASRPQDTSPDSYGSIFIDNINIDQSNGERGQE